jgi:hypothetical protein
VKGEAGVGRPCSGEEGHWRRGPRGVRASGAYGGQIEPRVEGRGGRERGSRREPEAAAEGSMTTAMFQWTTLVKDLRMSFSESWGRYWCNQLGT